MAASKIKLFPIYMEGDKDIVDGVLDNNELIDRLGVIPGEITLHSCNEHIGKTSDVNVVFIPKTASLTSSQYKIFLYMTYNAVQRAIDNDNWNLIPVLCEGETDAVILETFAGTNIINAKDGDFHKTFMQEIQGIQFQKKRFSPLLVKDAQEIGKHYVKRNNQEQKLLSLLESGSPAVGLHGLPGVGKTTLAAAVSQMAQRKNVFEKPDGDLNTTLAAAVSQTARRKDVYDYVKWIPVGEVVVPLDLLNEISYDFTGSNQNFSDMSAGKKWLQQFTSKWHILFVLDDIWDNDCGYQVVDLFNAVGKNCQLLLTSRKVDILTKANANYLHLDVLNKQQSKSLLLKRANLTANCVTKELDSVIEKLLEKLQGMPLAIALVGSSLRTPDNKRPVLKYWEDRLKRLPAVLAKQKLLKSEYDKTFKESFDISFDNLHSSLKEDFLHFCIFKHDIKIPSSVFLRLRNGKSNIWQLKELEEASLITQVSEDNDNVYYNMHDLVLDYAKERAATRYYIYGKYWVPKLHRSLLDAYFLSLSKSNSSSSTGYLQYVTGALTSLNVWSWLWDCKSRDWWTITDDNYIFDNLAHHLIEGGLLNELGNLLLSYHWIKTKFMKCGLAAVIADFQSLGAFLKANNEALTEEHRLVCHALELSSFHITRDNSKFALHMAGRLLNVKSVKLQAFVQDLQSEICQNSVLLPLTPFLTPSGEFLHRTISYQKKAAVTGLVVCHDKLFISLGNSLVKAINLTDGQEETLGKEHPEMCHQALVACIAEDPLEQFVVTGSSEKVDQIKLWILAGGIEDCKPITLSGHSHYVYTLLVTPDGNNIISGSEDHTIHVRDISGFRENLQSLADCKPIVLNHHTAAVRSLSMVPDPYLNSPDIPHTRHFFSVGVDSELVLWSLDEMTNGKPLHSVCASKKILHKVAVTLDGKWVIVGGEDSTLMVFNVGGIWKPHKILESHNSDSDIRIIKAAPCGQLLLSGDNLGSFCIWNIKRDFSIVRKLSGVSNAVRDVLFLPVAKEHSYDVVSATDCYVLHWKHMLDEDASKFDSQVLHKHQDAVISIDCDYKMEYCVTISPDFCIMVWNITRVELVKTKQISNKGVKPTSVVVLRLDDEVLSLCGDTLGYLHCFDLTLNELWRKPIHAHQVSSLCSFGERNVLFSCSTNNEVVAWEVSKSGIVKMFRFPGPCHGAQHISVTVEDDLVMLDACYFSCVVQWKFKVELLAGNHTDYTIITDVIPYDTRLPLVVSHLSGKNFFIIGNDDDSRLRCLLTDTNREQKTTSGFEDSDLVTAIAITTDWLFLVVGNSEGELNLICNSGKSERKVTPFDNCAGKRVSAISISSTQDIVFVGYVDGTLNMYHSLDKTGLQHCSNWPLTKIGSHGCNVCHLANISFENAIHMCVSVANVGTDGFEVKVWLINGGGQCLYKHTLALPQHDAAEPDCSVMSIVANSTVCNSLFIGLSNGELFSYKYSIETINNQLSAVPRLEYNKHYCNGILTLSESRDANSQAVVFVGLQSDKIIILNAESGEELRTIQTNWPSNIYSIDFTCSKKEVMIFYENRLIELWKYDTDEQVKKYWPYQSRWGQIVRSSKKYILGHSSACTMRSRLYCRHTFCGNGQSCNQMKKSCVSLDYDTSITAALFVGDQYLVTGSHGRDLKIWRLDQSGVTDVVDECDLESTITSLSLVTKGDQKCIVVGLEKGQVCIFELQFANAAL